MEALEIFLVVALLLVGAAVLLLNGWFQWGWGPLPCIARRFGIELEPKERSDIWSRWFRR